MTTCFFAWVLVVVLFPLVLLLWATESRHTRIQRLRRNGATWKKSPSDTSAVKLPLGDGLSHDALHLQWLDAGAAGWDRGWT